MTGELIKILAICLTAAVLCVTLKPKSGEYALLIAVGAGVVISIILVGIITPAVKSFGNMLEGYKIETEYFSVGVKAVGISYLTTFIAEACRDCGQSSLAAKAELAGKCAIFILSLPLLMSVLKTALGFIK